MPFFTAFHLVNPARRAVFLAQLSLSFRQFSVTFRAEIIFCTFFILLRIKINTVYFLLYAVII